MLKKILSYTLCFSLFILFSYVLYANNFIQMKDKKQTPKGLFAFRWGHIAANENPDAVYLAYDSLMHRSELLGAYSTYRIVESSLVKGNSLKVSKKPIPGVNNAKYQEEFRNQKKSFPWESFFSSDGYDYTVSRQDKSLVGIRVNVKELYSESVIINTQTKKTKVLWRLNDYYAPVLSPLPNDKRLVIFMSRKAKHNPNLIDENTPLDISTPVYNLKTGEKISDPKINGDMKWKQDDNILAYLRTVDPNRDPVIKIINFNN